MGHDSVHDYHINQETRVKCYVWHKVGTVQSGNPVSEDWLWTVIVLHGQYAHKDLQGTLGTTHKPPRRSWQTPLAILLPRPFFDLPECQGPRNHVSSSQRGVASLSVWPPWGCINAWSPRGRGKRHTKSTSSTKEDSESRCWETQVG